MTNTKYLEEIKAREQKATPGPWELLTRGNTVKSLAIEGVCGGMKFIDKSDADFIAHSRTDIPALLAEVERLKKDLVDSKKKAEYCRNEWHASTDRIFHYLDIIDKIREIDESSVKEACISLGDTEFGYEQEEAEK